jgi:hypothetical protein
VLIAPTTDILYLFCIPTFLPLPLLLLLERHHRRHDQFGRRFFEFEAPDGSPGAEGLTEASGVLELAAVALADCREATGRGRSIGPGRATGMNGPYFAT